MFVFGDKNSILKRIKFSFCLKLIYFEIRLKVQFVCKYLNRKITSVYTDDITNDITVRFKKANRTVT
jgi:hypothetical protein